MTYGNGSRGPSFGVIRHIGAVLPVSSAPACHVGAQPHSTLGTFHQATASVGHGVYEHAVPHLPGTERFGVRPPWVSAVAIKPEPEGALRDYVEVMPRVFEVHTFAGLRAKMAKDPYGKYLAYRALCGRLGLRVFPGWNGLSHHALLQRGEGQVVGAGFIMFDGCVVINGKSRGYPTGLEGVRCDEYDIGAIPHALDPDGNLNVVKLLFEALPGRDIPVEIKLN